MEKRHAMVVKATGKVARIPAKEVDADHTKTCELVEVGPEVEAGMWRQRDGSFAKEQDKSYHSKPEAKAKREHADAKAAEADNTADMAEEPAQPAGATGRAGKAQPASWAKKARKA